MMDAGRLSQLSATQAAARLGVKVETIYAYVSRGLLARSPSPDGRTSLFDARAVERLASRRRGGAKTGGLSVVLGTGLTLIEQDRLCYRGLDVAQLAREAPFESVAEWLWLGELPPTPQPEQWRPWSASDAVLQAASDIQRSMPEGIGTADRLRGIAAAVAPNDPLRHDLAPAAVSSCARQLISALVDGLPLSPPTPRTGSSATRRSARRAARSPRQAPKRAQTSALRFGSASPLDESLAGRLWPRLTRARATPARLHALNATLVLAADHGLAASTFAARVAASVRADPCSVVAAGLATLSGSLHGAASAPVHRLLSEVEQPDRAVAVLGDFLRREQRIPGFGHVIYKGWDPRATVLLELVRAAALDAKRMAVVERMLELLLERAPVRPNIDFVLGSLSYASGMEERAGETLFGVARCAGWIAHALEEYQEPALRFRPRAHYIGAAPGAGHRPQAEG